LFAEAAPSFNIKGQDKLGTWYGMVCSIILYCTLGIFISLKSKDLFNRRNPTLSNSLDERYYNISDAIDLS